MRLIKRQYEEGYHQNPLYREAVHSQRNRARLAALRQYQSGGRLLEIGCGMGGFLRVAQQHFEVEGVDISQTAVNAIQKEFGKRVRVSNIEQEPLPHRRYQAIVVFNILEHLQRPDHVLHNLSGALAQGGLLIGSVPLNHGPVGRVVTRIGNFFDRTHVSTFPPDRWRSLFQSSGLGPVEEFGEITFGRNRCHYLRSSVWPFISFNWMFLWKL